MSRSRDVKRCPRCGHTHRRFVPYPGGNHHACVRCVERAKHRARVAEFVRAKVQSRIDETSGGAKVEAKPA